MKSAKIGAFCLVSLWSLSCQAFPQDQAEQHKSQGTAATITNEWQTISPEGAEATCNMPGTPEFKERTFSAVRDTTTTVHFSILNISQTNSMVFAYNDLPNVPDTMAKVNETLDGAVKGAVGRTLGKLVSGKKFQQANYHGREFTFTCVQGNDEASAINLKVLCRVYLIKDRLYQLTYVAQEDEFIEADAAKFVSSFKHAPSPTAASPPDKVSGK